MKQIYMERNRCLLARFRELLGTMPVMTLYATLAQEFDLSEDRARHIIADRKKWQ